MIIREHKPEDREAIEKCIAEFNKEERVYTPHFLVDYDVSKPYFDYLNKKISEGNGKIFVAVEEGNIVGYVAVKMEVEDSPRNVIKKYGYISNVMILKEHRGKGFGEALVKKAEEFTKESGANNISLDVQVGNSAINLYHKLGYKECTVWMEKKIDE